MKTDAPSCCALEQTLADLILLLARAKGGKSRLLAMLVGALELRNYLGSVEICEGTRSSDRPTSGRPTDRRVDFLMWQFVGAAVFSRGFVLSTACVTR